MITTKAEWLRGIFEMFSRLTSGKYIHILRTKTEINHPHRRCAFDDLVVHADLGYTPVSQVTAKGSFASQVPVENIVTKQF